VVPAGAHQSLPTTETTSAQSVALSGDGNLLAVGAYLKDSANASELSNGAEGAGAAYIFVRNGGEGQWRSYLKATTPLVGAGFSTGLAISADGRTLVAGAYRDNVPGGAMGAGRVYAF
jgi:hypothetical protein